MSNGEHPNLRLGDFIWKNMVGKRVLVAETNSDGKSKVFEYEVLEVSPSELRVKFRNAGGGTFWTDHKQYRPVEILS